MSDVTIYGRADENILADAVITSTVVPSTSYTLAHLGLLRPDVRVIWATQTVTIRWTPATVQRGDVLVIPVSNLDAGGGSPSANIQWTSSTGLAVDLDVPTMPPDGIPKTLAVDLALADTNVSHRTPAYWQLVIAGNTANVILGGGIALYQKRTLTGDLGVDLRIGFSLNRTHGLSDVPNSHLSRYIQNYQTKIRSLTATIRCDGAAVPSVEDWFDANSGRATPGLLWPQGSVFDAYLGTWLEDLTIKQVDDTDDTYDVTVGFEELSKGKPVV